jgi:hypothetical protein
MWLRGIQVVLTVFCLVTGAVAPAAESTLPGDLLKNDQKFRASFRTLIGKSQERWLSQLNGPQLPIEYVAVGPDDEEYLLLTSCKAHSCNTDNAMILYSPKTGKTYARIEKGGKATVRGDPPWEVAVKLVHLYMERSCADLNAAPYNPNCR